MANFIRTLKDATKTNNIFPRTKLKAISDDNGVYLSNLLSAADLNSLRESDLLKEEIIGTTQQINFNTSGQVSSIVHKKGSTTYRTDSFTYGTDTITEARTISTIGTLTIVTNLETLVTTVTFTAA